MVARRHRLLAARRQHRHAPFVHWVMYRLPSRSRTMPSAPGKPSAISSTELVSLEDQPQQFAGAEIGEQQVFGPVDEQAVGRCIERHVLGSRRRSSSCASG